MDPIQTKNIAETLVAELPKPFVLGVSGSEGESADSIIHFAVPKNHVVVQYDNEPMLARPRRTKATATMTDEASFVAYVERNTIPGSVVWCDLNPSDSKLSFTAVFDEHDRGMPGWRAHQAKYTPRLAPEWVLWTSHNKQTKSQMAFAEFIEQNEQDISTLEGYPTSLDMMKMATEFEARQDQRLKSTVRLQSGGVALDYVANDDAGTIERMKVFDKFAIGIPVFWSVPKPGESIQAYQLRARLRYRQQQAAVNFHYELIRPDLIHQRAAQELIERVRAAIGSTPLLMGSCA